MKKAIGRPSNLVGSVFLAILAELLLEDISFNNHVAIVGKIVE